MHTLLFWFVIGSSIAILAMLIFLDSKAGYSPTEHEPTTYTITVIKDIDGEGYFVAVPTEIVSKLAPGQKVSFKVDRYEIVK